MLITERTLSHICKLDGTFRTCIHKPITALRVKFCSSDDFCKFFHICWLDIDDVEALILDIKVPKIDAQVVTTNESLAIAIDRNAVDMICVSVCVRSPRHGSNDSIMVRKSGKFERRGIAELCIRVRS